MLTVLSVGYPFAPVNADPAGGAEQVLAQLDRALVQAGHRSIVLAQQGSDAAGELLEIPATGAIDGEAWQAVHRHMRAAIDDVANDVDVVHLHGFDFDSCLPPAGPATLVTLHLPLEWYTLEALTPDRPRTWLHPVSADQSRRAPAGVALLPAVPNGVDTDAYRPNGRRGDYALVIGRVAPEKGFEDALAAAALAGVPARAAGHIYPYPEHRAYFEQQVAPLLDNERLWLGPVVGADKRRLLAEARCVLVPSTAPETSSLVAMEALASGTPVIAYSSGALPDIVEHGVTGFIVDGLKAMAEAIAAVDSISPEACRAAAEARFSAKRMTAAYLDLYAQLAA